MCLFPYRRDVRGGTMPLAWQSALEGATAGCSQDAGGRPCSFTRSKCIATIGDANPVSHGKAAVLTGS